MNTEYIYGLHAVAALLEKNPQNIIELMVQQDRSDARMQKILSVAKKNNIKTVTIGKSQLNELVPECSHQGVLAKIANLVAYQESDILLLLDNLETFPFILILDGVQDPHNLGACLRSANAAGVDMVLAPKDNAVGLTPVVHKVACGAAETTPFIRVTNLVRTMNMLKERGIWLYGADGEAETTVYHTKLVGPLAVVLGAEQKGLRRLTKENCDAVMRIPMLGTVSSLNVSVATGICLFEAVRQRQL